MLPDHELQVFEHGVNNLLEEENIPADAASDESNWISHQDGRLKLVGGRIAVGAEGTVGSVQGEIFGYKVDGTKVHWRKVGTKIQYFDGTTWQDVVTGLSAIVRLHVFKLHARFQERSRTRSVPMVFFKFHNANPASYLSMYSATSNFKGYAFIDKRPHVALEYTTTDKTGFLYGSHIDAQDSTVYTNNIATNLASGDGSTKTFTGTLSGGGSPSSQINFFVFSPYGQIAAALTITAISKAKSAIITTSGAHGLSVGDKVVIQSVVGMTQINNLIGTVNGAS